MYYGSVNQFLDPTKGFFRRGNHFFIQSGCGPLSKHHFLITEAKIYEETRFKVSYSSDLDLDSAQILKSRFQELIKKIF